jgi:hypothetical protein
MGNYILKKPYVLYQISIKDNFKESNSIRENTCTDIYYIYTLFNISKLYNLSLHLLVLPKKSMNASTNMRETELNSQIKK